MAYSPAQPDFRVRPIISEVARDMVDDQILSIA